ncbi:MAG: formate C-acetyltransferase/glycerol dehydratase family glycyl radical enzyme [Candidatus Hermodarchaeota archaeon]
MVVKPLNEQVRGTPHLSLKVPIYYTQALKDTTEKSMITKQANGLKKTLENLPIIIRPDEIIVGTFDVDVPVAIPRFEASGFRILKELETLSRRAVNPIYITDSDIKILKEQIAPFYEDYKIDTYARKFAPDYVFETSFSGCAYVATEIGGIAHAVIDYPQILSFGLKKYIEISQEKIKDLKKGKISKVDIENKIAFFNSIIIISDALIRYAHKFSEEAEKMALEELNSTRKKELLMIAEVCNKVPEHPPSNFHEAIQFLWFIHMALHIENFEHGISFGRIDQYLNRYYNGETENALRLIKNLLLKTNEIIALYDSVATQYFGGMATTQNILIGGIDEEGEDATNELTYIILQAIDELSVPSPNLVIRIHKNTPSRIYQEISKVLAKSNNVIGLYNDDLVVKSLINYGIPLEEARNYGVVGCVGLSTSGTSFDNTGAIFLNLAKAIELALGTDKTIISNYINQDPNLTNLNSIDDFLDLFSMKLKSMMKMATDAANAYQEAHKKLKPTPLMSLCIKDCFKKGVDVNEGSARYNFSGIHVTGFSDVVDSIAAIERAVFKEIKVNMETLIDALKRNFRGYKDLRNYLLYKCPKYGNDDDQVDMYARKATEILFDSVEDLRCARGGEYRVGIHAMTTHVGFGIFTGALPSGRKKGKPLTRDVAPGFSANKGLTATLNSIAKLNHSLLSNGVACTININPELIKIEDGKILESLLRSYVNLDGSHIQFNSISVSDLEDAQERPENYQNFMVRVSGYSARFIDLPKAVQDDIIARHCYKNI